LWGTSTVHESAAIYHRQFESMYYATIVNGVA
jgi:hypothetical protein